MEGRGREAGEREKQKTGRSFFTAKKAKEREERQKRFENKD